MSSQLWSLSKNDYVKGVVIAILAPVFVYLGQILSTGDTTIDWHTLGKYALAGFLAYLGKNFASDQSGKVLGHIG